MSILFIDIDRVQLKESQLGKGGGPSYGVEWDLNGWKHSGKTLTS